MNDHLPISLAFLFVVVACGSPDQAGSTNLAVTDDIVTVDFTVANLGGFGVPKGECHSLEEEIFYTRATRTLEWESCSETTEKATRAPFLHTRVLSETESKSVEDSLAAIEYYVQDEVDGYDGLTMVMSTFTPTGLDHEYRVACYNTCGRKAPKADDTWKLVRSLAHD